MSDQLVLTEPDGTITVPATTLAQVVVRAAELVDGAKVRRPRRNVDVDVTPDGTTVSVRLTARYGSVLPELADGVQREVGAALGQMCGVDVRAVDVSVEELVEA